MLRYFIVSILFLSVTACQHSEVTQQKVLKAKLIGHTVMSGEHPMSVWEKSHPSREKAILLVHGRTWSAVPDFDLQVEGEELSLMDGLVEKGFTVYAIDMRGYGNTPRDSTGWLTPDQTATDLANVLKWISRQGNWKVKPHLFGWSMGSTMSQLCTQRHPDLISSLTVFGYWKDSDADFPEEAEAYPEPERITNTAEAAASDFITPGSISQKAIDAYVEASLKADPIKVDLRRYDQFNELDPALVKVPTLILQGEFDPLSPTDRQSKLFTRLGHPHKQWVVVKGGDHAAFMETPRNYFIHALVNFLNGVTIE